MDEINKVHDENVKNHNLTFEELVETAQATAALPSGLDLISQAAFLSLRNIHITWKYGYLTHEEAKLERQKVRNRYIKMRERQAFDRRLMQEVIENRKYAALKEAEILKKLRDGQCVEVDALACLGYLLNDKSLLVSALDRIMRREKDAGYKTDRAAGKNNHADGFELQKLACTEGYKCTATDCASAHKHCACN